MKTLSFVLLLTFVLASFGLAQLRGSQFDKWDRNQDGKLTKDELPKQIQRNFERVDANKDGFISRQEDADFLNRNRKRPTQNRGKTVEGVKRLTDLDYAGNDNPRQKLDLYLPENPASEKLPVVVWIHGGGWKNGDKASGGNRVSQLVASGKFAGASIGYRLSAEAKWPSQIHDCKAAIRWLKANAAKHGLDSERIAVWGSSAGGHLVAMLGVSHGVADLEGEIGPHTDQSSEVACVVDYFGPTELLTMNDHPSKIDHNAPDSPESQLVGGAIQENQAKAKNASPIEHVSKDDEPILIVHGTADQLVPYPQSVDFAKKLKEAGVSATLITVQEGGHGGGFGPSVLETVTKFLENQFLGAEHEILDWTIPAGE